MKFLHWLKPKVKNSYSNELREFLKQSSGVVLRVNTNTNVSYANVKAEYVFEHCTIFCYEDQNVEAIHRFLIPHTTITGLTFTQPIQTTRTFINPLTGDKSSL